MLMKTSRDLQMLFAALTHLNEASSLEKMLMAKAEKSNLLHGCTEKTVPIREEQSILFFQMLIRNKISRFCSLE
jgi:hypothetical protein